MHQAEATGSLGSVHEHLTGPRGHRAVTRRRARLKVKLEESAPIDSPCKPKTYKTPSSPTADLPFIPTTIKKPKQSFAYTAAYYEEEIPSATRDALVLGPS